MKGFFFLLLFSISLIAEGKVVLVHGFINQRSMNAFSRLLKKNDWQVINWKYPSRDKTIQDHANDLVKMLHTLEDNNTPTHLIGFSLGGLVIAAALNHADCPAHVKAGKVVVISSPLKGSKLARSLGKIPLLHYIFGKYAGAQLSNTDPNGFDSFCKFKEGTSLLVISGTFGFNPVFSGKNDGKVGIDESCPSISHSHKFVPASHSFICRNLDAFNLALDFLENKDSQLTCPLKKGPFN
jgi:pimeloyl-ACP methyl ester carboxylesterase